ncbi:MAG: ATP-binding protein [Thermoplasmata archaeon]|nr:ATP-binding protein [Thermoplasmata archaeon]
MNRNVLKELIVQAQEMEIDIIERELKLLFTGRINAIIGPRRAGKTFFIYQAIAELKRAGQKDKIIYINFEDERLLPLENMDMIFDAYYELYPENIGKKLYLFFDEIQEAPAWQKFVRRLHERKKFEICITGSSSKLLSKEIATELRGRTLTHMILPYSFREFLTARNITIERNFEHGKGKFRVKSALLDYVQNGGFPEVVTADQPLKVKILQEYFNMIFYRDLVERYKIRNFDMVREMLLYLINNFALNFSMNKYHNLLGSQGKKIGKNSLFAYLAAAADVNLVFMIPKFGNLKNQMVNPKKVYVIDNGLVTAISSRFSPDKGRLYENLVLVELKRRNREVYYWKEKHECDFLVKEQGRIIEAIQVCYEITEENREREIAGLIEAMEKFNLKKGLIITADFEGEERIEGKDIRYEPLWKWLLGIL